MSSVIDVSAGSGSVGVADVAEPRSVVARRVGLARDVVDHQDPIGRQGRTEVVAFDQGPVSRVGDEQLALGVGEVAGQLVAPVGRVAADHHRAGERRAPDPEHELGDVVEEQRDVEGAGAAQRARAGPPARAWARSTSSWVQVRSANRRPVRWLPAWSRIS